jgi:hypothetical protein
MHALKSEKKMGGRKDVDRQKYPELRSAARGLYRETSTTGAE